MFRVWGLGLLGFGVSGILGFVGVLGFSGFLFFFVGGGGGGEVGVLGGVWGFRDLGGFRVLGFRDLEFLHPKPLVVRA